MGKYKGTELKSTPVYETYWKFAAKRQDVFMKRVKGLSPPWTEDEIIKKHRFTNTYRASDRVSQYLIKNVIYKGSQNVEEVFFRTLLFKIFNKIKTWETLVEKTGEVKWSGFNIDKCSKMLDSEMRKKTSIYSAAYIIPSPNLGKKRKHQNHLYLLKRMMKEFVPQKIEKAKSLEGVYNILRSYPSLGNFLAFQFAIDLNYSNIIDFSEMDFVVAGPGAKNGIMKCFLPGHGLSAEEIIRIVAENSESEFKKRGLKFKKLWGRSLQLIDCQNLFCEVDKYSRIAHPEFLGKTKRVRIKQKYTKSLGAIPQWYPPKWNLQIPKVSLA